LVNENTESGKITDNLIFRGATVVTKSQYDAFYQTELEAILNEKGIKQLIVTGVMTHLCCESTIRAAFIRGFEVLFPVDGTATYNFDFHRSSFLNISHGFATPVLIDDLLKQLE
jgi:isochorismate hydrolase